MIIKSDKEYNDMWESTSLIIIRDLFSQCINPSLSSVIPAGEYRAMKQKLNEWIDKLEVITLNNEQEGKVCTHRHKT